MLPPQLALGQELRLAFWNSELSRAGPGLLLRDLVQAKTPDVTAVVATLNALAADVVVLADFDYDAKGDALAALNAHLQSPYPYLAPLRPNTGIPTGLDLDGNGRRDEARDAMGFGRFPGEGGMAILSRLPIVPEASRDFTQMLWRDLPGHSIPALPAPMAQQLRLSTSGHHITALRLADGRLLRLMTWHATPPAFDHELPLNLRRNHDETALWLPEIAQMPAPFVVIGQANTDPEKGKGDKAAIQALLAHPRLQDPLPGDTVDYGAALGRLRVSYILPAQELQVTAAGHMPQTPPARHWPIWVNLLGR